MIKRRHWTNTEHRKMKELILSGVSCGKAARRLGRPRSSVWARAVSHGLVTRPASRVVHAAPSTVLIVKEAVPAWYVVGWRFEGFFGRGFCRMSWRSAKAPVIPSIRELIIDNVREAA